jgi:hypothetical protein
MANIQVFEYQNNKVRTVDIDKAFNADQTKHEQMEMAAGMEASIKGAIG